MHTGIDQASIEFNPGSDDGKVRPSVTYTLKLELPFDKRYKSMAKAFLKKGVFAKIRVLWLLKKNTPLPGSLEKSIQTLASKYLPANYQVVVNVL